MRFRKKHSPHGYSLIKNKIGTGKGSDKDCVKVVF
ncbi:hypothetical protein M2451_000879 [Dysgonomonas sp. PFB1-18]|nr:hypothetical protein [Dysgonomonas sp. PF1-14]MDH6338069.1 hypothetical protein [Dysgonomonas sp. PF1-16]MDH6379566.1 hypothetical protein [Dysgonomonas sp. PFB1-18]MDH6396896.1 hypothetical protein [Dysgonomonas sp. PF1-23]